MNRVYFSGHLGRDFELKTTKTGKSVASSTLAVKDSYKSGNEWKENTTWVSVEVWGVKADWVAGLTKGTPLFVEGRLAIDEWEKDGVKKSRAKVLVNEFVVSAHKQSAQNHEAPHQPLAEEDIPF